MTNEEIITKYLKEFGEKISEAINKEWREGRRCEICGEAMKAQLGTNTCDNCWENG